MEIRKKKGRPQKPKDREEFWRFGRSGMVICAYDEAREQGHKHTVAITDAVEFVKQRHPEMPISKAEVRRVLAGWRPRGSQTILRFERKVLTEDEIKKYQQVREQLAELKLQGRKGLKLETLPDFDLKHRGEAFAIRVAERPNYPRHNRKSP
jgi:hypothetical protein